ncbi:MAG TPA: LPS assembly lipoprotein LptE [Rhodanobacteraceae bacterium]|nr:LPS assembly lipoprotein LptE [Rhodanobacteraceae bacterium]
MHIQRYLIALLCIACMLALAGCGFHLRGSAALPAVMQQQVYLQVGGGGEFPRSLAAALRASKVNVLDTSTEGVATLAVPVAAFGSRMLTSGAVQRVGEYVVTFNVQFTLTDAQGKTIVPMQTISLSHEFAIDQTQFSAITSETEAIQRSLVREMTDAVMRRLEAQARLGTPTAASSAGAPGSASSIAAPASASSSG